MKIRTLLVIFFVALLSSVAHAQCPSGIGSTNCEKYSTFINATPAVTSPTSTDRIPYVQGAATLYIGLPNVPPIVVNDNKTGPITVDGASVTSHSQPGLTAPAIGQIVSGSSSYYGYDAVRGLALSPAGSTVVNTSGVSGYVRNQAVSSGPGGNSVALFGIGTCEVNGCKTWGLNAILQDNNTYAAGSGTNRAIVNEMDFNVMNASTTVTGFQMTGASLVQPTEANAFGVNPLDQTGAASPIHWTTAFVSAPGASVNGLFLGSQKNNVGSPGATNGQPIALGFIDSASVNQQIVLQATATSGGTLALTNTAGTSNFSLTGFLFMNAGNFAGIEIGGDPILSEDSSHNLLLAGGGSIASIQVGNTAATVSLNGPVQAGYLPTQAHASGNACVGYNASTHALYLSSSVATC